MSTTARWIVFIIVKKMEIAEKVLFEVPTFKFRDQCVELLVTQEIFQIIKTERNPPKFANIQFVIYNYFNFGSFQDLTVQTNITTEIKYKHIFICIQHK